MGSRSRRATEGDVEIVVPSRWDDDSIDDASEGYEASFRPERMNLERLEYRGWFPRLLHMLYPLVVLAHYPATLFLDYNLIYMLALLAGTPSLPSTSLRLFHRSFDIPTLSISTAYWVALAVYATCTFLWAFVVCFWVDFVRGFLRPWGSVGRVPISQVYRGAASFNLACMSSFRTFSFLWRVRLAPFQRSSPIALAVRGNAVSDGVAETFSWYSQNWPTVILLIPRAGLSLAILLLFGTKAYGSPNVPASDRDSAYFHLNGTLTGFAMGVLLTNCAWAALRLLVVVFSFFALAFFSKAPSSSAASYFSSSREHLNLIDIDDDSLDEKLYNERQRLNQTSWRLRRDRRLRAAIFVCLRSSAHPTPSFSPYFKQEHHEHHFERDDAEKEAREKAERRERREKKRLAKLALNGIDWQQLEDEDASPDVKQSGWGALSPYVLPSPRVGSPLMTFSPATNSEAPNSPQPASVQPTTGLHRRVRSIPVNNSPGEENIEQLDVGAHRSPPPRPLSIPGFDNRSIRQGLKSHFSFISDGVVPSGNTTPATEQAAWLPTPEDSTEHLDLSSRSVPLASAFSDPSPASQTTTSSSFPPLSSSNLAIASSSAPGAASPPIVVIPASTDATPSPDQRRRSPSPEVWRSAADIRQARHDLLQRELTQGAIERRRLSERLLVEVQRLGEAEEAVRREERRLATLRRISEATEEPSMADGEERNRPYSGLTRDSRDSRMSSASAWSHTTGAALSSIGQERPPFRNTFSSTSSVSIPPALLLPPFRLSYGSSDASLADLAFEYEAPSPNLSDISEFGDVGRSSMLDNSATAQFLGSSDDEDRSETPTQARQKREFAIHRSPGGDTFGTKTRESMISSRRGSIE